MIEAESEMDAAGAVEAETEAAEVVEAVRRSPRRTRMGLRGPKGWVRAEITK